MSRLESMRRRLTAQIEGINWAARQIEGLPGEVVEVGLGNGRTYDHLRQELAGRKIWVIDRQMKAHPSCVPPEADFLQGEADEMLQYLIDRGEPVQLVHYDLGIGVAEEDIALTDRLGPLVQALVAPGGLVVSSQPFRALTRIDGPHLEERDRYFFYRIRDSENG